MATKKRSTRMASDPRICDDDIRRRAYQLYEERGQGHGNDVDDWLRAERELTTKTSRAAAA